MPRRSKRAADQPAEVPENGTVESAASPPEAARNGTQSSSSAERVRKKRAVFGQFVEAEPDSDRAVDLEPSDTPGQNSEAEPDVDLEQSETPGRNAEAVEEQPAETPGALKPVEPAGVLIKAVGPIDTSGPRLAPDPGLYAVLGLDPSATDAEIQTTYRRQAARLLGNGLNHTQALRQLNVAYEVLGNPVRRAEYDRLRLAQLFAPGPPTPFRRGAKAVIAPTRRTRPRQVVQPRYAGLPEVLVVLLVVGVAVLTGTLIIPRVNINLSALNAFQNILPLSNSRRIIDQTVTPAPAPTTSAPTPTVRPGLADRFANTAVSVSNPNPPQNSPESVMIRLRRDGQPASNFDVWAIVQYRTTEERWPPTGAQKTDTSGAATITFNIGPATLNYPVTVRVFAQVDDQQLSWSTTFTPR